MLEKINSPADLKKLTPKETQSLCGEIRERLLDVVSENGGHLASNLGVVELTVALHRVFASPDDKIIFDVGHQSYVHKMLTGRNERLGTLRKFGGISGFTSRAESEHDPFGCGHASTSLSAALGIAEANRLNGSDSHVIAVVGDGAFTGGMIYEALNNCAGKSNLIIVLNDNEMSISRNVGGISSYFSRFRTSARYFKFKNGIKKLFGGIPLIGKGLIAFGRSVRNLFKRLLMSQNLFEQMGLKYYGPISGNDEKHLETVLREAAADGLCSVVHVCTTKGKGYAPAEQTPDLFHGISGFNIKTGKIKNGHFESFAEHFGKKMCEFARADKRICAITAAMAGGTGLEGFEKEFPERFFDVGIAEEHAVTFAAGLASSGMKPVFAVYSTFAQRCYDQIIHDAALQKLPVVMALDHAGIVGADGPTHHGLFDVAMLLPVPGIRLFACESFEDVDYALSQSLSSDTLSVLRYSKGAPEDYDRSIFHDMRGICYRDFGSSPSVCVFTYGKITKTVLEAALDALKSGARVRVVKMIDLKPLSVDKLKLLLGGISSVIVVEEGIKTGGFGEMLYAFTAENRLAEGVRFRFLAVPDMFVPHGSDAQLYKLCSLDKASVTAAVIKENQ